MITVAICTWNRAESLNRTLSHFAQAPLGKDCELLVVDNNSRDETPAVLQRWRRRLPLTAIVEPSPGLANARNAALKQARGENLIFTDDDVAVPLQWLPAYREGFQRWPQAGFFGGPIDAAFDQPPPAWLLAVWPVVRIMYGECDHGDTPVELAFPDPLPFGANFAVRRDAIDGVRFDPRLGLRGDGGTLGEETAFFRALLARGVEGRYLPGARLVHRIPPSAATLQFLRRRYEAYGRMCFIRDQAEPRTGWRAIPKWLLRKAVTAEMRYRVAIVSGDPRKWIEPLIDAASAWGALKYCVGRH